MTRSELADVLGGAGVDCATPAHVTCLVMQAELDAVLCSGPLRGKKHTYALFDEGVPAARTLERSAALRSPRSSRRRPTRMAPSSASQRR